MSNIPAPAVQGMSNFGMGMGWFDNKSAIAVGGGHYFENGLSIKGSVSGAFDSSKSTTVGAGFSYSF